MDYSQFAKYFGNENLSDSEVKTLLGYTLFFIFGLIIIFTQSKKKYSDALVFHGLYWIIAQNTYHLEHGEQSDQYSIFAYLMIFGLLSFMVGYSRQYKGKFTLDKKQGSAFFILGSIIVLGIASLVLISPLYFPIASYYPQLSIAEYEIAYFSLVGGIFLFVSYLIVRNKS